MRCLMNACPTRLTSAVPPAASIVSGHGPAGAHVVEDLAARALREHHLGQQRGHEVAGDELARVVDEEAAVGVTVVGDAEVGTLLARLRDDELAVLGQQRVRLVVREVAVGVEVAADDLDAAGAPGRAAASRPAMPFAASIDDPQRLRSRHVDEGEHLVDEARPDVEWRDLAAPLHRAEAGLRARRGRPGGRSRRRRAARRGGRSSCRCTASGCARR